MSLPETSRARIECLPLSIDENMKPLHHFLQPAFSCWAPGARPTRNSRAIVSTVLDDALRMARRRVRRSTSRARVWTRATGAQAQARSQNAATASTEPPAITRTLKSQFSRSATTTRLIHRPFQTSVALHADDRFECDHDSAPRPLAQAASCVSSSSGGLDFSNTSFRRRKSVRVRTHFSQTFSRRTSQGAE